MWIPLLVCFFALASGADVKPSSKPATPVIAANRTSAVSKRQTYAGAHPADPVARGAHPDAYPTAAFPGPVQPSYGPTPGQYVVRGNNGQHQEVPQEYIEYLEQVQQQQQQAAFAQQQQLEQQRQQILHQQAQLQQRQQPKQQLVQQLVVTRDPSAPRRPATRRPPTEQQLLQQSFFQSNQLQGQIRQAAVSRPNPTPPGSAPQLYDLHQARLQATLAQDPNFQVYSQSPQVFPQPSQIAQRHRLPAPRQSAPPPQEQYLRETSPSVQPLIVSLNREEIQVQTTPDQAVYYTSSAQTTMPTHTAYQLQQQQQQQQADIAAYLRQQQQQQQQPQQNYIQVQPSSAPPAYIRMVPTVPEPSAYPTQPTPAYRTPQPSYQPPTPSYRQQEEYLQQEQPIYQPRPQQKAVELSNQEFVSSILSQYPGRDVYPERQAKALPSASPSRSAIFVTTSSSLPKSKDPDVDDDSASNALPVVRLPTPQGQRALTQREFQALLAAGFDIQPIHQESRQQAQQTSPTQQTIYVQTSPKYQRSYVTVQPPTNLIPQTRSKPQREEQPQLSGFEAIVVPDDEPKQVRQRQRRPQLRVQARPKEVYQYVDGQQDAQTAYVMYEMPQTVYVRARPTRRPALQVEDN